MKKAFPAIFLALAIFLSACGKTAAPGSAEAPKTDEVKPAETAQIANPWSDYDSLQEAEETAGFSLGLPETIADSYVAKAFRVMDGEQKILEVLYSDPDCEVTVRKAAGEGQDISGIYGYDRCETEEYRPGQWVTFCREEDPESETSSLNVSLDHDGYSWSLFAPNGFWGDSCIDFLGVILGPEGRSDPASEPVCYDFDAQYVRIDSRENASHPQALFFRSRTELDDFCAESFDDQVLPTFEASIEKYDESWFQDGRRLLIVTAEEPSGSIRHEVTCLTKESVTIDRTVPSAGTADIATWYILVETEDLFEPNDGFQVEFTANEPGKLFYGSADDLTGTGNGK